MALSRSMFGASTVADKYIIPTAFEQMNAEFEEDIARKRGHIASTAKFNIFIVLVILVDATMIFIEVDFMSGDSRKDRIYFFVLDIIFALCFIVEMLLRQNQLGWEYFVDPWNVFDYSVVVLNCADIIVEASENSEGGLQLAGTFRVLRLLRVARTIKGLKAFYGLWFVVQGLLESLRTLAWVALLLFLLVYCIAVSLVTAIPNEEATRERWPEFDIYFGSVWKAVWSVMQIITLDNWCKDILRPVMDVSAPAAIIVFLTVVIGTFGVLNIVIAVMVERIRTIAQENKDLANRVLEHTEQDLFMSMASDFTEAELNEDGELGIHEFSEMLKTPSMTLKLRLLGIMSDEAEALFEIMDADLNGSVSPEEFVTGLQKLKGVAKGQDLVQLICFAQKQCQKATQFVENVKALSKQADVIQERLNGMGHGIARELKYQKECSIRHDEVLKHATERVQVIGKLDKSRQMQFPTIS
ncbi:unnamed protein product [Prorocentrum cordatum]|nr:unnamed protein product [Polarella glacialis]